MSSLIEFRPHALCGALLLLSLQNCKPAPPPPSHKTLPTNVVVSVQGHDDDETTAAVVAPKRNEKCPGGRVIISSGPRLKRAPGGPDFQLPGRDTLNSPAVLLHDLDGKSPAREVVLPPPTPLGDYNMVTSDSQLIRLANDNILLIYGAAMRPPLTDAKALAVFNQWKNFNSGWRGGFLIWRSSDCGDSWSQPWVALDAAAVTISPETPVGKLEAVGIYGWPQGTIIQPWLGGYDMQWAYTDPWRPNSLYIASQVRGGTATVLGNPPKPAFPGQSFDKVMIFVSNDGGVTWNKPTVVLPNDGVDYPVTMTSLPPNKRHPQGRLFAFRCIYGTGEPRLYWSDDQWKTLAGEAAVYYGGANDPESKCTGGLDPSKLPLGGGLRYSGGIALSRVKSDHARDWVRVAYPSITAAGRQVERLVLVEIAGTPGGFFETVTVKAARTYEAENTNPNGHVLYASFIETDHVELKDDDVNTAVLYWAETSPTGALFMRYAVVKGGGADSVGEWSEPHNLSVYYGGRWPVLMFEGDWFGDYFKGAFFMDGLELKYLVQWPARTIRHRAVSYNIVTVQP